MTKPPPSHDDSQNRIVAVTLDEESIGRSGPDIEHERAIAIYDLVEQNLFALDGHEARGPFTLHIGITGNRLMFDIRREDGTPVVAQHHFGGAAPGTAAYNGAGDWVGVLFATYNGVAAVYAFLLPPLAAHFGRERVHVILFDDFAADALQGLRAHRRDHAPCGAGASSDP